MSNKTTIIFTPTDNIDYEKNMDKKVQILQDQINVLKRDLTVILSAFEKKIGG